MINRSLSYFPAISGRIFIFDSNTLTENTLYVNNLTLMYSTGHRDLWGMHPSEDPHSE